MRARPWVAVVIAAIIFALIPLVGLQLFLALPLIGLVLTAGTPPDYVAAAKTVDHRPRNLALGIVTLIFVVIVILQPQLTLWLVVLFGLDAPVSSLQSSRLQRWPCRLRWLTRLRRSPTCLRAAQF